MSTTSIIVNVIMSLFVLTAVGGGLFVAARLKPAGDEGRASGRGPLHVSSLAMPWPNTALRRLSQNLPAPRVVKMWHEGSLPAWLDDYPRP